mgnify:CR=1 FL=1
MLKKGLDSVKTPSLQAIAKKHGVSTAFIARQIAKGVKVEKEHTTDPKMANQIARDHLNERPDYYEKLNKMEKEKVSIKEESGTGGIRGLGNVTGDPAVGINGYINTNAM